MKKLLLVLFLGTAFSLRAQFKNTPSPFDNPDKGMIKQPTSSFILGFLNPDNLSMHHSFSLSYSSFGNAGLALGIYTNTLSYKLSNKLNFFLQTSIVSAPYSSLGKNFTNQINGIYIRSARLNYHPTKNTAISIEFSNDPTRYYYNPYYSNSYFGDPWYSLPMSNINRK